MSDPTVLQNSIRETGDKIQALIQLKDKVASMQEQQVNRNKALGLAIQNTKMLKTFFESVNSQLDNQTSEKILNLMQKVMQNEDQLNKLLETLNQSQ